MTSKRRKWVLLLLGVIAVAAWVAHLTRDREPSYKGKPLSEWIIACKEAQTTEEFESSEAAVRAIGTNALPYLLQWISYELPAWRQYVLNHLPGNLDENDNVTDRVYGNSHERAEAARIAFGILGTNAIPAIPALEALLQDRQTPRRAGRALLVLNSVGSAAFPVLTNALANPGPIPRYQIIYAFAPVYSQSTNGTNMCLPVLLRSLSDHDEFVRTAATNVIRLIAPEALTNAPPQ